MSLADEFAANAETAGFVVHRGEPPEIDGAGVSRAVYALADTGSVVLAASPDEPPRSCLTSTLRSCPITSSSQGWRSCSQLSATTCRARWRS